MFDFENFPFTLILSLVFENLYAEKIKRENKRKKMKEIKKIDLKLINYFQLSFLTH